MKHQDIWNDKYKGIYYEIARWESDGGDTIWNYYIYLALKTKELVDTFWLEKKDNDRIWVGYDYMNLPIEMHGGITYYKKEMGFDGGIKIVKLGCDYNHIWDEGKIYDEYILEMDAKETIDCLLDRFKYEDESEDSKDG